ncbi:MAG TPA: alpha/beta hydrolase [Acidimicrobiales bacterium]|nr:alpha/beta hydrolase [Acidimicrobiales bacterium]
MTTSQIKIYRSSGPVVVTVDDLGEGRPFLLLHGGAGPRSVRGFADLLVAGGQTRAIVPTHPGFEGTVRSEALTSVRELASTYCLLLDALEVQDVTVVGNSIGGWIAAEMAVAGNGRISRLVVVDGMGIEVPEHPPTDVSGMSLPEISQLSYHNPARFRIDPSALPPEAQAVLAGNRASLALYGGATMSDPTLRARLAGVAVPSLVVWGDSDGIAGAEYGRAFAAAIPRARFELLPGTGHLPQLESPDKLLSLLADFTHAHPAGAAKDVG